MKRFILCLQYLLFLSIFICNTSSAEELNLSGSSYILMDEESGRILLEREAYKKMSMASTTKIMTALIAIENGNLEDKVVIDSESAGVEGSSIYLQAGEIVSLKDLLYGLMLRSGNDSSLAIAKHIGGSEADFLTMMNEKAKLIKAVNTNFANPHGLSHTDHYSTAYDLALITKEAFKNQIFREIFATKTYIANREKNNYFVNKNKTLWEYKWGDGGKTGYTMQSGRCLVSSAKKNGMRLIAVSLNARNWFKDNYKLFDYGFDNFTPYVIYDKNQFIKKINIVNGKEDLNVVTKKGLIYPLQENEKDKIKLKLNLKENVKAPVKEGSTLGTIEAYLDGVLINRSEVLAKNSVSKKSMLDMFMERINLISSKAGNKFTNKDNKVKILLR